jgi:O-acetyl-ADP-ribose deacetylase (regulator of RNase III)
MSYEEINGDLIQLALTGNFDVVVHGCNCFCTMGAGIAPKMAKAFKCDTFKLEDASFWGDINKLGQIDYEEVEIYKDSRIYVVNAYTQYNYGKNHINGVSTPLDYEALTLCMRKINHNFKDHHIGLPQIGCGLAGGDWSKVKAIIQKELKDCNVTIVMFK